MNTPRGNPSPGPQRNGQGYVPRQGTPNAQNGYRQNPQRTGPQVQGQRQGTRPLTEEELLARKKRLEQQRKRQAAQQAAIAKQRADAVKRRKADEKKRAAALKKQAKQEEKQRLKAEKERRKSAERMRRHDERFELTEEERAIREEMKKEEREYAAKERAARGKVFLARFFVFLGMFVVLLAAAVGVFFLNLHSAEWTSQKNYTYTVGKNSKSVSYEKSVRNGTVYVNLTPIVDLCSLATTGDQTSLRYITRSGKENVQFNVGSRQVFMNGAEARLSAAPVFEDGELWVPYDFFPTYVSGLTSSLDEDKNKIDIKRVVDAESGEEADLSFIIRSVEPLAALNEYNEFGNTSPVPFMADLDLYEEYMNPADRDAYLILANEQYPLPQAFIPDTVEVSDIRYDGRPLQYVCQITDKAAHAMVTEARANGYTDLSILLGYRSYGKQNSVFQSRVNDFLKTMTEEKAEIAAANEVQRPGCNPQQAGYSIILHDILTEDSATTAFAKTDCFAWLAENCWKFGFILRYPADKVNETGLAFQPCFFTFVGRYHAMRIAESGLSFEEYIAQLEERDYFGGLTYEEFYTQLLNNRNR